MNRSDNEIQQILATFRSPALQNYPEFHVYSCDDLYRDCFGGGGLYLAVKMLRTLRLHQPKKTLFVLTAHRK